MSSQALDLEAIRARYEQSCDELDRLTTDPDGPGASWRWSIPANPSRDSDLILSASLADVPSLLAEAARLRDDLDMEADTARSLATYIVAALDLLGSKSEDASDLVPLLRARLGSQA